jgi:hypothetical protein
MPPPIKPVIYVFRHAHDFDKPPKNERPPNFNESSLWERPDKSTLNSEGLTPDGEQIVDINGQLNFSVKLPDTTVTFPWKRLDDTGKRQAQAIKDFITQQQGINVLPIGTVIVQDPNGPDNSQNTFYTAKPLYDSLKGTGVKIKFVGLNYKLEDVVDFLTSKSSVNARTSTVICLDRQKLWGYERDENGAVKRDGNKDIKRSLALSPDKQSVMGKVGAHYFTDFDAKYAQHWQKYLKGPEKGGVIYKLWDFDSTWEMDMEQYELSTSERISAFSSQQ